MASAVVAPPLVSVVLATFNGRSFLREQILSIANQSYKNIELIVQDDCSTDDTLQILKSFENQINIEIEVNETRIGFVRNFERALHRVNGKYVALCDQDDIWHSEKIAILIQELSCSDMVHSNCSLIDSSGKVLDPLWKNPNLESLTVSDLLFRNYVTGCTVLMNRDLLQRALPFPQGIAYHDWWLAVCAATGNGIRFIDRPLVYYRQHASQDTGANIANALARFFKRFSSGYEKKRKSISAKQLNNLYAARNMLIENGLQEIFEASVDYHSALNRGSISIGLFFIGLKHYRTIRPFDRFRFLKFILNDFFSLNLHS